MSQQHEERRYAQDERLAKMEVIVDELKHDFNEHNHDEREFWKALQEDVSTLKEQMQRYQGVIGGVMIVFSALWAGFSLFKDWIIDHLK